MDETMDSPKDDARKPAEPPAETKEPPGPLQLGDSSTEEFRRFQETRTQVMSSDSLLSVENDDGAPAEAPAKAASPGRAHECLEIRTPIEEFETYVRARIDTLTRLGEQERVEITIAALELGKRKLARITGTPKAP